MRIVYLAPFSTHYWENIVLADLMGTFGYGFAMIGWVRNKDGIKKDKKKKKSRERYDLNGDVSMNNK